jgi:hypothetical protein
MSQTQAQLFAVLRKLSQDNAPTPSAWAALRLLRLCSMPSQVAHLADRTQPEHRPCFSPQHPTSCHPPLRLCHSIKKIREASVQCLGSAMHRTMPAVILQELWTKSDSLSELFLGLLWSSWETGSWSADSCSAEEARVTAAPVADRPVTLGNCQGARDLAPFPVQPVQHSAHDPCFPLRWSSHGSAAPALSIQLSPGHRLQLAGIGRPMKLSILCCPIRRCLPNTTQPRETLSHSHRRDARALSARNVRLLDVSLDSGALQPSGMTCCLPVTTRETCLNLGRNTASSAMLV